jgi:hypothetical protein
MSDAQSRQGKGTAESESLRFVGPPACVAPVEGEEANTIALIPPHLEYLRVQILFHGVPVPELKVKLKTHDGVEVPSTGKSDAWGVVKASRLVPPGRYMCEIEHQDPAEVSSVASLSKAYPVVLPVGRPYADLRERSEFPLVLLSK